MEPTILDYLRNAEEQRKLRQGVLDALNRGIVAGGLGGVADMGNTVLNLGKAAYGYVGNKTGLLSADQMPELVDKPVLGSEWWGDLMQSAGMVSAERNEPAELAAGLLAMGAQTKAPQVVRGLLAAERNLAAPVAAGPMAGQRGALFIAPNKPNKKQLEKVMEEMRTMGAPEIRAHYNETLGAYQALEGSHRLAAAKKLGLDPVVKEMSPRQWLKDHDLYDLPDKTSVARALNYLDGSDVYWDFPGVARPR